jgi:hemoglobin
MYANAPVSTLRTSPEAVLCHPDIDRNFIGSLVRDFYDRVRRDRRLGPIFASVVQDHWEPHLEKMTDFWCSVILKDRSYQGRPVPAHLQLQDVRESDFELWLEHFRATVEARCSADVATIFFDRAERIAKSLQLAMFYRLERPDACNDL